MADFPYYYNYDKLTDFELNAMGEHRNLTNQSLLYVGNGALPYTPLMFKIKEPSLDVACLDRDAKAVELGTKIFDHAGQTGDFYYGNFANCEIPLYGIKNC